ncbi:unnamed protein product [Bursaphelenchus okinawaensis]|uniref:Galectin n=1 Tax=Bursaphelenchus okinawaensis TaxID=465554 RepID=A0A811JRX8_9BILA|nr:unnamed protein product [Bursaphelenchus okinawaensis]CAG9080452.1 unnamed protein product [Bursaphelenchus okinawaensis]
MFVVPIRIRQGVPLTLYNLYGGATQLKDFCMDMYCLGTQDYRTQPHNLTLPETLVPGMKLTIDAIAFKKQFTMSLLDDDDNIVVFIIVYDGAMMFNCCVAPCKGLDPNNEIVLAKDSTNVMTFNEMSKFEFFYWRSSNMQFIINDDIKFYLPIKINPGGGLTQFKKDGFLQLDYVCMKIAE